MTIRLITHFELAQRKDQELSALFWDVCRDLARSDLSSPERRNALASLENISRERAYRLGLRPLSR